MDCTNAGPAELTIEIISDSGTEAEVHIQDNGDGTYTITYIPLYPGSYTLTIRYGGQDVPNFPARLTVEPAVDASGVRVFGPGVEGKGKTRIPDVPAEKPTWWSTDFNLRKETKRRERCCPHREDLKGPPTFPGGVFQVFSGRRPQTSPWTLVPSRRPEETTSKPSSATRLAAAQTPWSPTSETEPTAWSTLPTRRVSLSSTGRAHFLGLFWLL